MVSRLPRTALYLMLFLGTGAVWAQSAPRSQQQQSAPPQREQREHREQREPPQDRGQQGQGLPDSVRRVERQTGGEVLRAEPMQRDGREVYRLKVLTSDGRVRVVQDDPERPREPPADRKGKGKGSKDKQEDTSRDSDEDPPL
jgi:hypothetical protein